MFPKYLKPVSNWFRARRNARLVLLIDHLHEKLGGPVAVLDVGGSYIFWQTVPNRNKCQITLLNLEEAYRDSDGVPVEECGRYCAQVGDARDSGGGMTLTSIWSRATPCLSMLGCGRICGRPQVNCVALGLMAGSKYPPLDFRLNSIFCYRVCTGFLKLS